MVKEPDSMDELIYFTNRTLDNNGKIKAWVYKAECTKCHKARMGKPVEKGKVKIRAGEYVCPECGHSEPKDVHEKGLVVEIIYTCPFCGHIGEATTEYRRRNFNGVPSYVFTCDGCGKKIGITRKMKK